MTGAAEDTQRCGVALRGDQDITRGTTLTEEDPRSCEGISQESLSSPITSG